MKKQLLVVIIIFSLPGFMYAQPTKNIPLPKSYLFDHFIVGSVLSMSGTIDQAPLNYNAEDQSIIFFRDGQHFILTNLETVDTVYIDGRKFVPAGNIIYEVLTDSSPVNLLVSYHSKTRPMTSISNHDSTTKKVSNDVSNAVTDVYVTRPFNGDNSVEIQKRYWLGQGNNIYKANTEKQFVKVFSANQAAVRNYIKISGTNFGNTTDLVKLLNFCNNSL
ncbi:MAG: hypothetical protein JWM28_1489 [Chitinophagaceae bacterium]|nr:hypothetical protein [Chitinophagaceae bacterium]